MSEELTKEVNEEILPTQLLLKLKRKAAYEKAKAQRKIEKKEAKKKLAEAKKLLREKMDQEIMKAMKSGSDLE